MQCRHDAIEQLISAHISAALPAVIMNGSNPAKSEDAWILLHLQIAYILRYEATMRVPSMHHDVKGDLP